MKKEMFKCPNCGKLSDELDAKTEGTCIVNVNGESYEEYTEVVNRSCSSCGFEESGFSKYFNIVEIERKAIMIDAEVKEFKFGKTYRFSEARFCKALNIEKQITSWAQKNDGNEVKIFSDISGDVGNYSVCADWCEEVEWED